MQSANQLLLGLWSHLLQQRGVSEPRDILQSVFRRGDGRVAIPQNRDPWVILTLVTNFTQTAEAVKMIIVIEESCWSRNTQVLFRSTLGCFYTPSYSRVPWPPANWEADVHLKNFLWCLATEYGNGKVFSISEVNQHKMTLSWKHDLFRYFLTQKMHLALKTLLRNIAHLLL